MNTASRKSVTAYLHGFLSGPGSKKGRALAAAFEASGQPSSAGPSGVEASGQPSSAGPSGVEASGQPSSAGPSGIEAEQRRIDQLDLNRPSAPDLTISAALAELDAWYSKQSGERVALVGSSLGGYLAALFAARHPEAVRALVLLCPGIDMTRRWPLLFGAAAMARWQREGRLALPNARGVPVAVHWGFIEDAFTHEPIPTPTCPTLIIHGTRDAVVPVESSRAWVATLPDARLVEVDDDHELIASLPLIASETLRFLFPDAPVPAAPSSR